MYPSERGLQRCIPLATTALTHKEIRVSSLLYSLGRWSFRSRRLVLALWIAALAVGGGGAIAFNQGTDNSFSIPGTESQEALDSLSHTFPQVSGTSAQIVIVAPKGSTIEDAPIKASIEASVKQIDDIKQVGTATSPFDKNISGTISDNKRAAVIPIQLDGGQADITAETKDALLKAGDDLRAELPSDSEVAVGGELFSQNLPTLSITELLGVAIALVVLILTLGAFLAAGMPLLNAILGVAISMTLIFLATLFGPISSTTPMLALMLGLAVGIDYALFVISRHQEQLRDGLSLEESTARSVATAGSAVIFAGLTVIIALLGLSVANIPFLTVMGVAAAAAVAIAVLISITLTPALLGFAGAKILPRTQRKAYLARNRTGNPEPEAVTPEPQKPAAQPAATTPSPRPKRGFFGGWVAAVTRFPLVTIIAVVGTLGVASIPALDLRLALPDAGSLPEDNQARIAYDLLSENFGEGFNGPLIVTGSIVSSKDPVGLMNDIADDIRELDGVAAVPLATPNATADTGIVQVIPKSGPDSDETKALVKEIRSLHDHFQDKHGVSLSVTGFTAIGIDISDRLGGALLPFGLLVVGLSLILLTMVFRSVWVPLKATLGYLLSVGASFGAVAAVFQWGWFAEALNVARVGPIISFMPIILMGVLFGLAMDYEVFLVSRIREEYVHGGHAQKAIRRGFMGSAKVVTAAAVIMFAVFAAFVPEGDTSIKPIALGLAVGVFVDAFIVRMTLVPAVLAMLGDRAWWMPRWLDRILPSFDVEGEGLHHELALADWPVPGSTDAINASDLSLAVDGDTGVASIGTPTLFHDVAVTVPAGGTLIVTGATAEARTALLLTLSGRISHFSGKLKVVGKVLPQRGSAVRSRTSLVLAGNSHNPLADLRDAAADLPSVILIDGADALLTSAGIPATSAALAEARDYASSRGKPLALVLSGNDSDELTRLVDSLPDRETDARGTRSPSILHLDTPADTRTASDTLEKAL